VQARHLRRDAFAGYNLAMPRFALLLLVFAQYLSPLVHYRYEVIRKIPHLGETFTQGLIYHQGSLYESTGLVGYSRLKKISLPSGNISKEISIDKVFAEGLALKDGKLIQLTWKDQTAYVYDAETFLRKQIYTYTGEGWGLTVLGGDYLMSDGSSFLSFRSSTDFRELRRLRVTIEGEPLKRLNELEVAEGNIYANIWYQTDIAVIDPKTGAVIGLIDLKDLHYANARSDDAVLNGIAYDPETKSFFITGKRWPTIYEVKFIAGKFSSK
jgi:glutaminyl-peptide cyclotransferase